MRTVIRHATDFGKSYVLVTAVAAAALWMTGLAAGIAEGSICVVSCRPQVSPYSMGETHLVLAVLSGVFVVPAAAFAMAVFHMPFIMAVAYPLAIWIRSWVTDRRIVTLLGALLGVAIAPLMIAVRSWLGTDLEYRGDLFARYVQTAGATGFISLSAVATLGWFVSRRRLSEPTRRQG